MGNLSTNLASVAAVFSFLLGAGALAYASATSPLTVSLIIGGHSQHLPFAVVALGLVTVLLAAYYLGQFCHWVGNTPTRWRHGKIAAFSQRLAHHSLQAALGLPTGKPLPLPAPTPALTTLTLLHTLAQPQATPFEIPEALITTQPELTPLWHLHQARQAAHIGLWPRVLHLSTPLPNPCPPALLTLHVKALLNTGQAPAVIPLLPRLKPLLPRPHLTLFEQWLTAPAEPLHPWLKDLTTWLPTASDVWPA